MPTITTPSQFKTVYFGNLPNHAEFHQVMQDGTVFTYVKLNARQALTSRGAIVNRDRQHVVYVTK